MELDEYPLAWDKDDESVGQGTRMFTGIYI